MRPKPQPAGHQLELLVWSRGLCYAGPCSCNSVAATEEELLLLLRVNFVRWFASPQVCTGVPGTCTWVAPPEHLLPRPRSPAAMQIFVKTLTGAHSPLRLSALLAPS